MEIPQLSTEDLIIRHFDRTASPEEASELQRRLQNSPEARELFDQYSRLMDVLARAAELPILDGFQAPADFDLGDVDAERQDTKEPETQPLSRRTVWKISRPLKLVLLALGLVTVAVILLWSLSMKQDSTTKSVADSIGANHSFDSNRHDTMEQKTEQQGDSTLDSAAQASSDSSESANAMSRQDGASGVFDEMTVYQNDFEKKAGSEWSNQRVETTPVGNRRFLGRFANDTVSLTLANLQDHDSVIVSFDLFIIQSWDGNETQDMDGNCCVGPDSWMFRIGNARPLFWTTFSNVNVSFAHYQAKQSYPAWYMKGSEPQQTGAAEHGTLGYTYSPKDPVSNQLITMPCDAVYAMEFRVPHTGGKIRLDFSGFGLTGGEDESWGVDNVKVVIKKKHTAPTPSDSPQLK